MDKLFLEQTSSKINYSYIKLFNRPKITTDMVLNLLK